MRRRIINVGALVLGLMLAHGGYAQLTDKVVSPEFFRISDGSYGTSVDIAERFAVVGAPNEDAVDQNCQTLVGAGAAYVYELVSGNTWHLIQRLTGARAGAAFGSSVAISEERIAIGAPGFVSSINDAIGAAYLFDLNDPNFPAFLCEKYGTADGDQFGFAVDVSFEQWIVGAPGMDGGTGRAFAYDRDCNLLQEYNSTTMTCDFTGSVVGGAIGSAVSICGVPDGNPYNVDFEYVAAIGIPKMAPQAGGEQGAIAIDRHIATGMECVSFHMLANDLWQNTWQFSTPVSDGEDGYGSSVDLYDDDPSLVPQFGNFLIVGAPLADRPDIVTGLNLNQPDRGAAYTLRYGQAPAGGFGWYPEPLPLTCNGCPSYAHFGASVAINECHALVGIPQFGEGRAFLFDDPSFFTVIEQFGGESAGDGYGTSVAMFKDAATAHNPAILPTMPVLIC